GEVDVGALGRLAADQVDRAADDQVRVGAVEVPAGRRLDAGRALRGEVSDDVRERLPARVLALEPEGGVAGVLGPGEGDLAVVGGDPAPVDVVPGEEGARVARVVLQPFRLHRADVGHVPHEQEEHEQAGDGGPLARAVHRRITCVSPSFWIACGGGLRAASDIRTSMAMSIQLASSADPPADMNGVTRPVSGMSRVTPPTMMNTCQARMNERPPASSL